MLKDVKIVARGDGGWIHEIELTKEEVEAIEKDSGLFYVKILKLRSMNDSTLAIGI